jgi:hypothetical protein
MLLNFCAILPFPTIIGSYAGQTDIRTGGERRIVMEENTRNMENRVAIAQAVRIIILVMVYFLLALTVRALYLSYRTDGFQEKTAVLRSAESSGKTWSGTYTDGDGNVFQYGKYKNREDVPAEDVFLVDPDDPSGYMEEEYVKDATSEIDTWVCVMIMLVTLQTVLMGFVERSGVIGKEDQHDQQ